VLTSTALTSNVGSAEEDPALPEEEAADVPPFEHATRETDKSPLIANGSDFFIVFPP
jgi:hypothetical protein